jgi:membrane protein implicated in regulation of membrane protease activity
MMTKAQVVRLVVAAVFGVTGAVALAIGVAFFVLWSFDSANIADDVPELIGGSLALACGAACVFARRRLRRQRRRVRTQTSQ